MSTLMGGQAEATEDMFSKLESMRAVITEVNTQFKDPVRRSALIFFFLTLELNPRLSGMGAIDRRHAHT